MQAVLRRLVGTAPLRVWRLRRLGAGLHPLHPHALIVAASLWMATLGNVALWRELLQLHLLDGWRGVGFALATLTLIAALLTGLLGLVAWRSTLKPVLTLLLLVTACSAHFMLTYHVVLDTTMVTNVLQTNPGEARDLASWRFAFTVLVLGVVPSVWIWRTPLRSLAWPRRVAQNLALIAASLVLAVGALLAAYQPLASAMRNHRHVRHLVSPLNTVQALGQIAAQPLRRNDSVVLPIGEDAHLGATYTAQAHPPLVVLVLGETGRAGNFGLNGYPRPTTPELSREGVASFANAWACGTSTAASVPCMFSHLGRDAFEARDRNYEGLVDVLQRAGLAVLWVDNQAGCKGVCARIPSVASCPADDCLDEVMLQGLDARIAALPAERRARGIVVVLHAMGSHGPAYHKRSPPAYKRFLPECTSNVLQDCTTEQLVNAYDNSIAYTDHVLAGTIQWLKRHDDADTAMLYVADHGESLGENNLYLHGLPYAVAPDVQKRVAWISWLSPGFEKRAGVATACLRQRADALLTHDHYFHSVLGLLDVQTGIYRRELDAYAACEG
jgi:lipid A ethanolaminephosphotransferase